MAIVRHNADVMTPWFASAKNAGRVDFNLFAGWCGRLNNR
jgi:hypothetical protein